MDLLRKIFRIPLLLLWFIGSSLYCRLVSRGPQASRRSLALTQLWAQWSAWILNLKIQVKGDPDFQGGLIAANHQGVLDILVLAAVFKIRFAPKSEMRKWPIFGFLAQCNQPVWIDRSTPRKARETAEIMSRTMQNGQNMMVFPEGTTSDGKPGLLPFKSTAFQAAIDAGSPVLPVIISYAPEVRSYVQWCDGRNFLFHIWGLLGLKETGAAVYIMDNVSTEKYKDRKELTAEVYDIMDGKWRTL